MEEIKEIYRIVKEQQDKEELPPQFPENVNLGIL